MLPLSLAQTQSHPLSQISPIDTNLNMFGFNITNVTFIGINLTNPQYALDVVGDVRWSGSLIGGIVPWARLQGYNLDVAWSGKLGWGNLTGYPSIIAGAGLTGGGDLGTSRSLSIAFGEDFLGWRNLTAYPTPCPAGYAVQAIGDDLACIQINATQGVINGSGLAGQVAFFTASNTITGSNNLYWDNTNARLGIGTNAPSYRLTVSGGDIYGSNNLYIVGNVGIGTTTPAFKLHVAGNAFVTRLYLEDVATWDSLFWNTGFRIGKDTDSAMRFEAPEFNFITGNVGIGTTAPRSKFEVQDQSGISLFNVFRTTGSALGYGTIGIGFNLVRRPDGIWEARGDGANNAGAAIYGGIVTGRALNFVTVESTGAGTQTFTDSDINSKVRMVITGTGNVGIGTTAPTARLHVYDSGRGNIKLLTTSGVGHDFGYDGGSDSAFWFAHTGAESGYTLFMWDNGTSYRDLLYIGNSGNVGIGTTTPGAKLHVVGTGKFETGAGTWNWIEINRGGDTIYFGSDESNRGIWSSGTRDVGIYTNGVARILVKGGTGNVGIGTTTPSYKLDVVGDIRATGAVRTDAVYSNTGYVSASGSNLLTMTPYVDNALGFRTPFKVEKWDGSTWVDITGATTWAYLTDGKPSTAIGLINYNYTPDATRIRFSYDFGGNWVSPAQQLVLYFQHVPTINSVLVEQADDNTFTTNLETLANVGSSSCGDCTRIIPTLTFWRRYLRITIEVGRPSGTTWGLGAREIAYYSPAYWGGSRLINSMVPIDWDYNKNVFFSNNVGIGTTSPIYKLHVQGGDIYSSGYVRGGTGLCIGNDCRTAWPTFTETDPYWNANISAISTNYLIKRSGTGIGQSIIYDTGTNVGIGTINPQDKLHVSGGKIRVDNSADFELFFAGAQAANIYQSDTSSPLYINTAGGPIYLGTGGSGATHLNIVGGNVGIGTTSPGFKLDVWGSTGIRQEGNALQLLHTTSGGWVGQLFHSRVNEGSDRGFIVFQDDSAQIPGSAGERGRLTIGVYNDFGPASSIREELWLQGGSRLVFNTGAWDSELNSIIGTPYVYGPVDGYEFRVNNYPQVVITGSGNVGIGTTSPYSKLDVRGGISWGASAQNVLTEDQGGSIELGGRNDLANPVIGGTPYIDFHYGTGSAQDYNFRIINSGNNRLDFASIGQGTFVTFNNGNVGIGTTNPLNKLEVVGTTNITSAGTMFYVDANGNVWVRL